MKHLNDLPIGVIDSGIGGLSVLNALTRKLPFESFIYYGDNKNAPYGNKSLDFIKRAHITIFIAILKIIEINLIFFNFSSEIC